MWCWCPFLISIGIADFCALESSFLLVLSNQEQVDPAPSIVSCLRGPVWVKHWTLGSFVSDIYFKSKKIIHEFKYIC